MPTSSEARQSSPPPRGKTVRKRARVLSSRQVFAGRVFSVRRDRVSEPGGVIAVRDIVLHPGSVVVLPVFSTGEILLIRQYRHAARAFLWELVAGRVDAGESPAQAAHRELAEETGYAARRLRKLLEIFPSPGFVSERMCIFSATGLVPGAARPEDDERIFARRFSLAAAERMIRRGRLRDAKSIAAILFFARFARH